MKLKIVAVKRRLLLPGMSGSNKRYTPRLFFYDRLFFDDRLFFENHKTFTTVHTCHTSLIYLPKQVCTSIQYVVVCVNIKKGGRETVYNRYLQYIFCFVCVCKDKRSFIHFILYIKHGCHLKQWIKEKFRTEMGYNKLRHSHTHHDTATEAGLLPVYSAVTENQSSHLPLLS